MAENTLSRRSFVAAAAATAGVAAAASVMTPAAQAKVIAESSDVWDLDPIGEPTETLECDIAIIGAGGTGMACACQAKQLGLYPIVLEKREVTGGSFIGTEGLFGVQTHWTKEAGEDLSVYQAVRQCMDYHHWVPNKALYERFFGMTSDTIDWLEDLGVEFDHVQRIGGTPECWHVYKRDLAHGPGGTFQDSMRVAAENLGIQIELETPVKRILVEDGKTVGVLAERADGTVVKILAPCVAVATGGYPQNKDFLYAVSETRNQLILPQGVPGNDADGIKMARAAGAEMAEGLGTVMWCGPCMDGAVWTHMDYCASVQPTMWINDKCERYINEDRWQTDFATTGLAQRNQDKTYIIFTQADLDYWENVEPYGAAFTFCAPGAPMTGVTEQVMALPSIHKCDTIAEMAEAEGLDPEALQANIDKYNGFCADGFDADFGKDAKYLYPVAEGPYYIAQTGDGYYTTCGGIKINANCEVEDLNHEVIPGLYAGGSDAGCLYGDAYDVCLAPGSQASWANNSGRIIAMEAAKYLGK